jgi:hypothetical protein
MVFKNKRLENTFSTKGYYKKNGCPQNWLKIKKKERIKTSSLRGYILSCHNDTK